MRQTSKAEPRVFDITEESDRNTFCKTVERARPGDIIIYHVGNNAGGLFKADAMQEYQKGRVALYRKRLDYEGVRRFQFMAERVRQKK